ncbi:MAG: hypothetical protein ACT4PK_04880 [Gammaproteobacteria bacterium]
MSAALSLVNSSAMRIRHFLRTAVPVLLGMTLAVTRADGAHLHFCLDGQEEPVELHSPDNGDHHAEDTGSTHQDRDLELVDDSLGKVTPKGFLAAALLTGAISMDLFKAARDAPPTFRPLAPAVARRFLLPPLRGPPA